MTSAPTLPAGSYLVTGGAGFIGSHLVESILAQGHKVRVLDDLSTGHAANLNAVRDRVDFIKGTICDAATVAKAMKGVTHVFHEAALVSVVESVLDPARNHAANVDGTWNVLEAARAAGVRRIVYASSAAVYGNDPALPKREDMRPQPASPYAAAKISGEYMLQVAAALHGIEAVCLRYFNVFGPRQDPRSPYSGVISKFVAAARAGEAPTLFGDGRQTRDFVFVGDVVQANLRAMAAGAAGTGEAFNIGTGTRNSLLDLLRALASVTGRDLTPRFEPGRPGDVRDSLADITRAREVLGYTPTWDLASGLAELWAAG